MKEYTVTYTIEVTEIHKMQDKEGIAEKLLVSAEYWEAMQKALKEAMEGNDFRVDDLKITVHKTFVRD